MYMIHLPMHMFAASDPVPTVLLPSSHGVHSSLQSPPSVSDSLYVSNGHAWQPNLSAVGYSPAGHGALRGKCVQYQLWFFKNCSSEYLSIVHYFVRLFLEIQLELRLMHCINDTIVSFIQVMI